MTSSKKTTLTNESDNTTIPLLLYFLLFLLLLLCYHNSFTASWHFDDVANILLNKSLHLENLNLNSIIQSFFAYPDQPGKLLRPVSNLSFALNWFFGRDLVFGYHLINFAIHFLVTIFLLQSCLLILKTPNIKTELTNHRKVTIAILAAVFWACNPIHTQAVTYIVQRAASLATFFYITGIWCYLKARFSIQKRNQSFLYFFLTFLCFLLAIGSKENTILFPFSILLIELIFFQPTLRFTRTTLIGLFFVLFLVFVFTVLLVGPNFFYNILNSYDSRVFNLFQRLISEARIVVFYISLLFFPSPNRLSITHDIQISQGLWSPPTTVAAIVFLLFLAIFSLYRYKKYPLLAFAILFFLLNHIVESSIIPLELIFEHRNYLPSLFLFLPLAVFIVSMIDKYYKHHKLVVFSFATAITVLFIFLCLGTISRNMTWQTERSLWTDSLNKAPNTARSYINLAHGYLYQDKDYQRAFKLYLLSLDKYSPTPWKERLRAYNNLGYIMAQVGNYDKAILFYDKALDVSKAEPDSSINAWTIIHHARAQFLSGKHKIALQAISDLTNIVPGNSGASLLYGEMLVNNGELVKGLESFLRTLSFSSLQSDDYHMALLNIALVFTKLQQADKVNFFLNLSQKLGVPATPLYLVRMEHGIRTGDPEVTKNAMLHLLKELNWEEFTSLIQGERKNLYTLPIRYALLQSYVTKWITSMEYQQ